MEAEVEDSESLGKFTKYIPFIDYLQQNMESDEKLVQIRKWIIDKARAETKNVTRIYGFLVFLYRQLHLRKKKIPPWVDALFNNQTYVSIDLCDDNVKKVGKKKKKKKGLIFDSELFEKINPYTKNINATATQLPAKCQTASKSQSSVSVVLDSKEPVKKMECDSQSDIYWPQQQVKPNTSTGIYDKSQATGELKLITKSTGKRTSSAISEQSNNDDVPNKKVKIEIRGKSMNKN